MGTPRGISRGLIFLVLLCFGSVAQAQTISITSADSEAAEVLSGPPNTASFTITRTPPNNFYSSTVTYSYSVDGSATSGTDYIAPPPANNEVVLTFFQPSVTIVIADILDDALVEGSETIIVNLNTVDNGGTISATQNSVTLNIEDNDVGLVSISVSDDVAAEGSPADTGEYTIDLGATNETGAPVTVNFTVEGASTAQEGVDFDAFPPSIDIPNGQRSATLTLTPIDDASLEEAETVTLTLESTNSPLFTIGTPNTADITIEDNDCAAGNTAPPIDPGIAQNFCNPPAATVDLNSFVTGGAESAPANATLRWSTNANPTAVGDLLPGATVTESNTYYAVYVADASSCFSPISEAVELSINEAPSVGTLTTPISACNNANDEFGETRIDLESLLSDDADDGDWEFTSGPEIINPSGGNSRVDFRNQPEGEYVYTYTTNTAVAPCTEATAIVTINVTDCDPCVAGNSAPVLTDGIPTTFCGQITTSLNDYAPNGGPNGTVLRWTTDSADPINNLVPANRIQNPLPGTYFGFYYDAANDCTSPLLTLSLVQNEIPEITGTTGDSLCGPGTLQLSATANLDATILWYTTATGGTPVRTGANFTTPTILRTTSYFVEATANNCVSPRTEVVATVVPPSSAGAPVNASSCNDADFGSTIVDLDDTFSGTPDVGTWSFTSGPSTISLNAENIVDFQGKANGDYVFTYTTTRAVAPCENATAQISIAVSSCDTDDDGDGLLGGLEAMLGTDPNNPDTDGDTINDSDEVGPEPNNPLDEDGDGIIDALDSNTEDADQDGVNDQQDPANENACVPNRFNGQCDTDGDGISDLEERDNGSDPDDACSPNATPNCADPIDLEVLKEVDIQDAIVDDNVVFTVTVNNLSDRKAINVTIGDLLETGFELNADSAPNASVGDYDIATGMWTIPEIAAMGTATLTVPVRVLEGGSYENTAELLASIPEDGTPDNNVATVTLNIDLPEGIDLVLEKTAAIVNSRDSLDISQFQEVLVKPLVGQEIIFKLKVTNMSENDTVSRIVVRDSLAPVFSNPRFTPELTPESQFVPETGVLTWRPDELPKDGVAELEIRVFVDSVGTFVNIAEIMGSSPMDTNQNDLMDIVTVNVSERTQVDLGIIFNQFSPNNDGVNDDLKINQTLIDENGSEVQIEMEYDIKIFNRYGSLVFEGDNLSDEVIWNGTRDGKNVPEGTYFYVLNVTLLEEVEGVDTNSTEKGWIQLIR